MHPFRNVACAISGGVDSATSALLLKRKGFNVLGVFMHNWDLANEKGHCLADHDLEDAQYVCQRIGIPLVEVNFVKEYWNDVFSQMVQGYEGGTTPNPDILCNKHIKFGALFDHVTKVLRVDAVATGHYARNSAGDFLEKYEPHKGARLMKPLDWWKDQTLFLCQINQRALQRTMFPVGGLTKTVVKEIALQAGLEKIVAKKESTGICFIGSRDFKQFIQEYIEPKPGNFVNIDTGETVGKHKGIHYWTVGQRTHISGQRKAFFVAAVKKETREILVASGTDHPALFHNSLITATPHWIHEEPTELDTEGSFDCEFRFQHVHPLIGCTVSRRHGGQWEVQLDRPLRALTAGQFAVFYKGEECLGGAKILRPGPSLYERNIKEPIRIEKPFT